MAESGFESPGFEGNTAAADGSTPAWATYVASTIGADHQRAGTKNQDAVTARRFEFRGAPGMVAFAVADGHGHSRHFRSGRGSKMAVTAAMAIAKEWARTVPAGAQIPSERASELVTDLVARWREMVSADLAGDPISGEQRAALLPGDPPEIPYGSTLLVGMLRADIAVLAQIGDGEMVLVLPDGRHLTPIPTDSRLDGTQTTSLCQPDAESAFRVALVNLAKTPVFAVLATTDGYSNAQADPNWHQTLALDLVKLAERHGNDWIGDQLSHWVTLCASSEGSGDDTSAALALNSAVPVAVPVKPARQKTVEAAITTLPARDWTLPSIQIPVDDPVVQAPPGPIPVSQAPTAEIPAFDQTMRVRRQPPPAAHRSHEAETNRLPPVPSSAQTTRSGKYSVPASQPLAEPRFEQAPNYPSAGPRSMLSGQNRLWLAGVAVAVLAAVIVYLLLSHGSSGNQSPALRPRHTPSPSAKATGTPHGSVSPGKGKGSSPSSVPTIGQTTGGGGST